MAEKICSLCGEMLDALATSCTACGGRASSHPSETLIDGRYAVVEELGRGGMGVVYLANDVHLGRSIALKVITPDRAMSPRVAAHLQREAAALASVRSDHVVQVYAFGRHEGSYFFAMEFVRGQTLSAIVKDHARRGERVSLARALTILREIAAGLDAVHAAGLIHRDVKPANIVVEERTGRAVLVDFGLALSADNEPSQVGGTPTYMAPEQAGYGAITARADVYSYACTAFKLLTGKVPYSADSTLSLIAAKATEEPPKVSSICPDRAPFDAAVTRSLARLPGDRHATCGELFAELSVAAGAHAATSIHHIAKSEPGVLDVLIVDDDPAFIRFATQAVQLAFYGTPLHVATAGAGPAALDQARSRPPALVLLDYSMPGMDGVETLARLRDLPRGKEARIIAVSAAAGDAEAWRFSVLGVQDFLRKPAHMHAIVAKIEEVAQRSGFRTGMDAMKGKGRLR